VGGARVAVSVRVDPTLASASAALARHLVERARTSVRERGSFSLVLSGGSTPQALYRVLTGPFLRRFPWSSSEFYFGDERCVSPRSLSSNYRTARATLLDRALVDDPQIHRIRGELGPSAAASAYARELERSTAPTAPGGPRFDIVLLGIGRDGHTASLFPGAPELREQRRLVVGVPRAGQPPFVPRVSLTLPALGSTREVCFLVSGAEKAPAVASILRSLSRGAPGLPASRVRPAGPLRWFLDQDAGTLPGILRGSPGSPRDRGQPDGRALAGRPF
jgi:6-phosphogluconolactonase